MRQRLVRCTLVGALAPLLALPAVAEVPPLPVLADGTTVRVSTNADGSEAPGKIGDIYEPSISANGRYVVFSTGRNLELGNCEPGTYLRDLVTGRLEMISIPATGCSNDGEGWGSAHSYTSISADGRFVAFTSGGKDLVAGRRLPLRTPTGMYTQQAFVRDRARKRTVLASEGYDGQPANASAFSPTVSDDGRFVAFESNATNLVRGDRGDPNDDYRTDIFLRDLHRGVTVRVGPNIRTARLPKGNASLSGNGRYVTFDAWSSTLAPHRAGTGLDEPSDIQVYVWDRVTGKTELVSRSDDGYAANNIATLAGYVGSKISRDGRWITFTTQANNLTPHVRAGFQDLWNVFLFDRVTKKLRRVTDGLAGEGGNGESRDPCLSADGRYVSFASAASNLGAVDVTPGVWRGFPDVGTDIYLYDRDTRTTRLVSKSTEGTPADLNSHESCPSNGGKAVVFVSTATTLVPDDRNLADDVFVHRFS